MLVQASKTLRVKVTARILDQPSDTAAEAASGEHAPSADVAMDGQAADSTNTTAAPTEEAAAGDEAADKPAESGSEPAKEVAPAPAKLKVPRIELAIGGEVLQIPGSAARFTSFLKRVVVEVDRDGALYDIAGPVEVSSCAVAACQLGKST